MTVGDVSDKAYRVTNHGSRGDRIRPVLEHCIVIALAADGFGERAAELLAAPQCIEHAREVVLRLPAKASSPSNTGMLRALRTNRTASTW